MKKIITLKNGLKFVVLSKIKYEKENYLYLSSYDNDLQVLFAKVHDEIRIEPVEDGKLITKLLELVNNKNK